jgi:hypothetical protein
VTALVVSEGSWLMDAFVGMGDGPPD